MHDFVKCQKGFTLAELLVAITIFAIGLIAIAGMQVTAIHTNLDSNTLSAGSTLAQGIMEDILSWSESNPNLNTSQSDIVWDFDTSTAGVQNLWPLSGTTPTAGSYSATYSIVVDPNGVTGLTQVTVVVRGEDPGNANRVITLVGFKRTV